MPRPTDYTDLDYSSLRARLVALAASVFPDVDWSAAASLEVLLLELEAYVGDVLCKYINNVGREARWGTAQQRRNLLTLIKLIGYAPPGAVAAQYAVAFTLSAVAAEDVLLPAGTIVRTAEVTSPVKCQILEDVTILAGQTTTTATVEHSEPQSDAYLSTGLADQEIVLSQTPYVDDSAVVSAANGPYEEVANFLASTATDRHYTVSVDDLDRATIRFGSGTLGAVPSGTVTIVYKTGGGVVGNVASGKLNRLDGSFTTVTGAPVSISVSNAAGPTRSGVDRTSTAQIRVLAPESLRVLGRAVAREDFEIGARAVPGIARALHLTSNESSAIGENEGRLFLVPDGGGSVSASVIADVLAQFSSTYPKLNTFVLNAQTAGYLTLNVSCKVRFRKGYASVTVAADIRARLASWFSVTITPAVLWNIAPDVARRESLSQSDTKSQIDNPLVDFGYAMQDVDGNPTGFFAWSDVFNVVRDTPGVLRVEPDVEGLTLNGERDDVDIDPWQFPVLGTVVVIDSASGDTL